MDKVKSVGSGWVAWAKANPGKAIIAGAVAVAVVSFLVA